MKPWNAGNGEGRITRPLRVNGIAYHGINVLMLWSEAIEKGYGSPIWMTFRQALTLKANVRKGEHGSLVVYADKITRTETDSATGADRQYTFRRLPRSPKINFAISSAPRSKSSANSGDRLWCWSLYCFGSHRNNILEGSIDLDHAPRSLPSRGGAAW
jgi:hypothetical protein